MITSERTYFSDLFALFLCTPNSRRRNLWSKIKHKNWDSIHVKSNKCIRLYVPVTITYREAELCFLKCSQLKLQCLCFWSHFHQVRAIVTNDDGVPWLLARVALWSQQELSSWHSWLLSTMVVAWAARAGRPSPGSHWALYKSFRQKVRTSTGDGRSRGDPSKLALAKRSATQGDNLFCYFREVGKAGQGDQHN